MSKECRSLNADGRGVRTVGEKTYTVAMGAIIVVDGKQTTLTALSTGRNVNVNLRVDLKTVRMIQTISQ